MLNEAYNAELGFVVFIDLAFLEFHELWMKLPRKLF
jgi:hypothetical protein